MVAISSSFVLLAILASTAAAPTSVTRDSSDGAVIDIDILSNDPSDASLADVDVNTANSHKYRRTLSSRLFGKRQYDDDDSYGSLLDVDLLNYDHTDDRTAHEASLVDINIGRRAPQTTGDVVSGHQGDDDSPVSYGPEIMRLRRAAFLGSRSRKARSIHHDDDDGTLLDVEVLGGHHHDYVDGTPAASVSPASAPSSADSTPSSASSASPSAPSPSSSASTPKSTPSISSGTSSGLLFDPTGIKQDAVASKPKVQAKVTKNKSTPETQSKASNGVKSTSKPKIQAALGAAGTTESPTSTAVSSDDPAPASSSTVPTAVYHTHDAGSLVDVVLGLKKREEPWVAADWERRPTSMEPLAAMVLTEQDGDRSNTPWIAPPASA